MATTAKQDMCDKAQETISALTKNNNTLTAKIDKLVFSTRKLVSPRGEPGRTPGRSPYKSYSISG